MGDDDSGEALGRHWHEWEKQKQGLRSAVEHQLMQQESFIRQLVEDVQSSRLVGGQVEAAFVCAPMSPFAIVPTEDVGTNVSSNPIAPHATTWDTSVDDILGKSQTKPFAEVVPTGIRSCWGSPNGGGPPKGPSAAPPPLPIEAYTSESQAKAVSTDGGGDRLTTTITTQMVPASSVASKITGKMTGSPTGSKGERRSAWQQQQEEAEAPMFKFIMACRKKAEWFDELQEPPRTGFVARAVRDRRFEVACMGIITLDSLYTAYAADRELSMVGDDSAGSRNDFMVAFEFGVMLYYLTELCLKLSVHRLYFFCNEEMSWNLFDLVLVSFSVFDQAMMVLIYTAGNSANNMTFVRTLRLFKIGKILRMLRLLRFLRDLRLMVLSIAGSFQSMFWAFVVLGLILYVFALLFVQGATHFLSDPGNLESPERDEIQKRVGSVSLAILTLYMSTTGGMDWEDVYHLMSSLGAFYGVFFIWYVTFFTFAVMNILTGIFVENATKLSTPDREHLMLQQRRKDEQDANELRELCMAMDEDGSGTLTHDEFMVKIRDDKVARFLATLGLEVKDAELFFITLTTMSGEDTLAIDDFVKHCTGMKGVATSIDLHGLVFHTKVLHRDVDNFRREAAMMVQRLGEALIGKPANQIFGELEQSSLQRRSQRPSVS